MNDLKLYVLSAGDIQIVVFAESAEEADKLVIKQYDLESIEKFLEPNTGNKYWVNVESYPIMKGVIRQQHA